MLETRSGSIHVPGKESPAWILFNHREHSRLSAALLRRSREQERGSVRMPFGFCIDDGRLAFRLLAGRGRSILVPHFL